LAIESATPFFRRGYLLVDLFFILSGFIISYTRDAGSMRVMSRREVYDFYVARIARIYPLHAFCLCAIVAATLSLSLLHGWRHAQGVANPFDPAAIRSFVEELLLVQAWIPDAPRWNVPSWSISAELFAYLLFPLVLLLRHHVQRWVFSILLGLPAAFYTGVLLTGGSLDIIAGLAPLRCLSGFSIGIFLCERRSAVTRWSDGMVAFGQLAAVAGSMAVLATPCPDPVIIPFFALLVIATWEDRGPLRSLLLHRPLLQSGELSYSVYLTHVGLIAIVFPIWFALNARVSLNPDLARSLYIAVCLVLVIIVSRWTHAHVEEKGRRVVRRLLGGRSRRAPRGASVQS
jgi:peptidoglycan/LPS O-acetylase OafA/YrhL